MGGGPPDLFFPDYFTGVWDVVSQQAVRSLQQEVVPQAVLQQQLVQQGREPRQSQRRGVSQGHCCVCEAQACL